MDKAVQIKSITPNDTYNLIGKFGTMEVESLKVDKRLIVKIDNKFLATSTIQEIKQTETGVTVITKNRVYELVYLNKEEI